MASKARLRAVEPGEAVPKKISSVVDAAVSGSRFDELVQMRLVIARALDNPNTSARDLAALSRRQIEISKEIEVLARQAEEELAEGLVSGDEEWSPEAI